MRKLLFKSIIWMSIFALVITAMAPVFYAFIPDLLAGQEVQIPSATDTPSTDTPTNNQE